MQLSDRRAVAAEGTLQRSGVNCPIHFCHKLHRGYRWSKLSGHLSPCFHLLGPAEVLLQVAARLPLRRRHERVRVLDHLRAGRQDLPADVGPAQPGVKVATTRTTTPFNPSVFQATAKQQISNNWKFHIPDLKVGTLDQLVGLSDDLGEEKRTSGINMWQMCRDWPYLRTLLHVSSQG